MKKTYLILFLVLLFLFSACTSLRQDPEKQAQLEQRKTEIQKSIDSGWEGILANDFDRSVDMFNAADDEELPVSDVFRGLGLSEFAGHDDFLSFDSFVSALKIDPRHPYSVALAYFISDHCLYDRKRYQVYMGLLENEVARETTPEWLKREYRYILFDYYYNTVGDGRRSGEIKKDLHILSNWHILGPFSNVSGSGFQEDFVRISSETETGFDDYSLGVNNWRLTSFVPKLRNPGLLVPLPDYLSYARYASIYAYKPLFAAEPGVYELIFSRRGSIEAWLDGEKIIDDGRYVDGDNVYYVHKDLESGTHHLVVKCNNLEDASAFNASFSNSDVLYIRSDLYKSLFPDTAVFDPLINGICGEIDKNDQVVEGYFWLGLVLMKKGWIEQARMVLDIIAEANAENLFYRWLEALFSRTIGDYTAYEQQMLSIAGDEVFFAPARKYALQRYIATNRTGKAMSYLAELKKHDAEWYYALESEMILHLIRDSDDRAYDTFSRLKSLFPDMGSYYLAMLRYGNNLTRNQINNYVSNLYLKGDYKTALYYNYYFQLRMENDEAAKRKLLDYLTMYPISETLWIKYVDMLYDDKSMTFQAIRRTTREIMQTFPLSYRLLLEEKRQSHHLYTEMNSYYLENKELFAKESSSVKKFLEEMELEKDAYREALEKLVRFYPFDLETRDELRKLNNQREFQEVLTILDSYHLIEQYKNSDFDSGNGDAVIVYNDRKELFFGDGASSILQHLILKVFTPEGVEANRYQYLEFNPAFGDGELNEAYILKEDGRKIYANRSGRTLVYPGLSPGDFIVLRYRVDSFMTGEINNEIWSSTRLQSVYPIFQKNFHLIYPKEYDLDFAYHNIQESNVGRKTAGFVEGYTRTQFTIEKYPAVEISSLSPDWKDFIPWVDISSIKSWDKIINWYEALYLGQCEPSLPIKEKAEELCAGAEDRFEKIRLIFDYVSGTIEYENLSFQYSNYIPQTAESVMNDGYGDCKDQSVLLISLLNAVGIDAYVALSDPGYHGNYPYLPSPRFSHVIVVVPGEDGVIYLDPTTTYFTFLELPASMAGSYILNVTEGGDLARLESDVRSQKTYYLTELRDITKDTSVRGSIVYQGINAGILRAVYKGLNEEEQAVRFSEIVNSWLPGFSLNALEILNFDTLFYDPRINFSGNIPSPLTSIGYGVIKINCPWVDFLDSRVKSWLGAAAVENGIEIASTYLAAPNVQTILIDVPEKHLVLHIPEDVHLKFHDSYADYTYEQRDEKIICTRAIFIPNQYIEASEMDEFQDFVRRAVLAEKEDLYLKHY